MYIGRRWEIINILIRIFEGKRERGRHPVYERKILVVLKGCGDMGYIHLAQNNVQIVEQHSDEFRIT
jgi:hypothetical protein